MPQRDWNDNYASGCLPWDTGIPDENLVEMVEAGTLVPGRVLEVGCGTGTNAIWLAQKGFDVLGVDLAAGGGQGARKICRRPRLPLRGARLFRRHAGRRAV